VSGAVQHAGKVVTSQDRQKPERVGEVAVKSVAQLLFSTGKSFTVDGLREKLREFFREEVRAELRAVAALNNVELITALLSSNRQLAVVGLQLRIINGVKAKRARAPSFGHWIYEIKFDGWRALALKGGNQVRLFSRNSKDLGAKFPEITASIAELNAHDAIIDGEIVALDEKGRSSFQLLQAHDMGQERPPILFYAFDLLQLNGKDMKKLPLEKRKATLQQLLEKPPSVIRYSASLGNNAKVLVERARQLGLEGLVGKREQSLYEVGARSGAWIKLKLLQEQEFVIGGYTGAGRHAAGHLSLAFTGETTWYLLEESGRVLARVFSRTCIRDCRKSNVFRVLL
jgi:DNA ligase D-like protein (predicted ligase)